MQEAFPDLIELVSLPNTLNSLFHAQEHAEALAIIRHFEDNIYCEEEQPRDEAGEVGEAGLLHLINKEVKIHKEKIRLKINDELERSFVTGKTKELLALLALFDKVCEECRAG